MVGVGPEVEIIRRLYKAASMPVIEKSYWIDFFAILSDLSDAARVSLILRTDVALQRFTYERGKLKIGLERSDYARSGVLSRLRNSRVYGFEEIDREERVSLGADMPMGRLLQIRPDRPHGYNGPRERLQRSALIMVERRGEDFRATSGKLLSDLSAHLEAAAMLQFERQDTQLRASVSATIEHFYAVGWAALDMRNRVFSQSDGLDPLLVQTGQLLIGQAGELKFRDQLKATEFAGLARRLRKDVEGSDTDLMMEIHGQAPIIIRFQNPQAHPIEHVEMPIIMMVSRVGSGADFGVDEGAELLCQLWPLSVQEARLAIALAKGQNIVQAGEIIGLSASTARNYSKRIYAAVGVDGLQQLVVKISSLPLKL